MTQSETERVAKGVLFVGLVLVLGKLIYPEAGVSWILPVPTEAEKHAGRS